MNPEKFGGNVPKNNEPENPSRRGFLKMALGGAALVGASKLGLEFKKNEDEINELFRYFKEKNIEDFGTANEAAQMLLDEMNKENIEVVGLQSGTGAGYGTERIDILRDFLTKHMHSSVGRTYSFQESLIKSGVYTRENLVEILSESTQRIEKEKSK